MVPLFTRLALSASLFASGGLALAQNGVSSAGEARTRFLGNRGLIPAPSEVAVEDFVNVPLHEIPRPKAGEAVGLDLRWSSEGAKGKVLQVGLSTALVHDRSELKPLNLSLVIDKSGSMAEANKLVRVKQALLTLVDHLREVDTLSIVTFDNDARVLLPAQLVRDREAIKAVIGSIQPGSSTNLDAGLKLGYEQDLENFRKGATNRVILLTDGIANRGVTDPAAIAQTSLGYNDRGVDLSTIGVGQDLNGALLQTLAKSGRGLYHFVADSADIEKTFAKEFQSLVAPVASEPDLRIAFDPAMELERVYGYGPKIEAGTVDVHLDNMNRGLTEVVLLRFRPGKTSPVRVRLTYYDLDQGKTVVQTVTAPAFGKERDPSVEKNAAIATLAQAMHDMASAYQKGDLAGARAVLEPAIAETRQRYPHAEDEDIRRTLTTAEKYEAVLTGDAPGAKVNLVPNGDFAHGNQGFVSDLAYKTPEFDCLWGFGYTVAPSLDSPALHHLFTGHADVAPQHPTGKEQVLYANAGGTDPLTVWSTVVSCQPHTHYRISFMSLSLNVGREWIPDFQIQANGVKSALQPAGYGRYGANGMDWDSGDATTAEIRIVRFTRNREGKLIAISNIEMREASPLPR